MQVRFWGVRADLAVPGRGTVRYGGHTACATVTEGDALCILDAGSGLTALGRDLMGSRFSQGEGEALFLVSHGNWDHTQGISFFSPFFIQGNRFTFYGLGSDDLPFYDRLEAQLAPALSPLQTLTHLTARFSFRESDKGPFTWGGIEIRSRLLPAGGNYPGGHRPLAYRLTQNGRSLIYIAEADYPGGAVPNKLVRFCQNADLLVHDAYFQDQDRRPGWAHSSVRLAVDLAGRAGIPRLALYHYNPTYDDDRIDEMVQWCQEAAARQWPDLSVIGAREGLELAV